MNYALNITPVIQSILIKPVGILIWEHILIYHFIIDNYIAFK